MKYFTIMPDYTGSCIRDDNEGQVNIEDLNLPQEFISEITSWHESYKEVIPLSIGRREAIREKIERLDEQGLVLSRKLTELFPRGAKVKYFSEGLLKYLPVL